MPSMDDNRVSETQEGEEEALTETDDDSSSDGSEPENEEEPQQPVPHKTVEQLVKEVVELLRGGTKDWKNIADSDKRGLIERTANPSGPTALHILADMEISRKDDFKHLVEYLVKSDRNLLLQVGDNSGYTPLHLAIYRRNRSMIKWICAACDDIDAVLRMKGTKLKRNCIHLAIEYAKSGEDKTARSLVDLASAETLSEKDEEGNTPLALAVEYNRCKKGQIKLIETIIERSDYFIRNHPEHDFNYAHQSPYMHHLSTEEIERRKVPLSEPIAREQPRKQRPESGQRPPIMRANIAVPIVNDSLSRPGNTMDKTGVISQGEDGPDRIQLPEPEATLKAARHPDASHANDSNASHASEIKEFLKKHYLRSRDQDAALEILYGRDPISG